MSKITWVRRISSFGMTMLMAGFGLTSIASAQSITNTGPGSQNSITSNQTNNCSVRNTTHVAAVNTNYQNASTGDATSSGNTSAGSSWGGWSALNPETAQVNGTGYGPWRDTIVGWMAQHASGQGWNSGEDNLSWMPSGAAWSDYNPMTWQANGQSFGNWYNGAEAYLNAHSPIWALGWPVGATGSGNFGGATSGNASNNNSANFSITINNAARTAAGVNACGQSNFVPPVCTVSCGGGMGGGPSGGSVVTPTPTHSQPVLHQASTGGMSGSEGAPMMHGGSSSYTPVATAHTSSSTPPAGGMGGGVSSAPCPPSAPTMPSASISNTGPNSSNNVTSNMTNNSTVHNNTNVSFTNVSTQNATTGDATVSGSTWASGAGSGYAANDNGTGTDASVDN